VATEAQIVAQIKSMNFANFNAAWNWYEALTLGRPHSNDLRHSLRRRFRDR